MSPVQKFKEGDLVVLAPMEYLRKRRHVAGDNEAFHRFYNYVKSKEPLRINWVYKPGELINGDEELEFPGRPTREYWYNIQTPRSKQYLFDETELIPYVEEEPEPESEE